MASFWTDEGTRLAANGDLDLDTDDLRVVLLSTNTTADTERDKTTVGAYTTLDEFNGTGYTSGGQTIAGRSLSVNGTSHQTEVPATANTWSSLAAGTRAIQGALIVKWVSTLSNSIPIAWIDTGGFPHTPSGVAFVITWPAAGFLQVRAA